MRDLGTETNGDPVETPSVNESDNRAGDNEAESDPESSDSSLITALASTSMNDSAWKSAPSYPPLYLSTLTEYLPPQAAPKLPKGLTVDDLGDDDKKNKDITWAKEKYEDSLELDQVFERFTQRVAIEGKQCIRFAIFDYFGAFGSHSPFRLSLDMSWVVVHFYLHRTRCLIYSGLNPRQTPFQLPNLTLKLFGLRGASTTPLKFLHVHHAVLLVCSSVN